MLTVGGALLCLPLLVEAAHMWLCWACERMLLVGVEAASLILGAAGAASILDVSIATPISDATGMASILVHDSGCLHSRCGSRDASNLVEAISTSIRVWQRPHQFWACIGCINIRWMQWLHQDMY